MTANKRLYKMAFATAVTGCTVGFASFYMKKLLEEKIGNQPLCQIALEKMSEHELSRNILGLPITSTRPNLANLYNHITETKANIAIPISGTKTKGNLLINASREISDTSWTLESLELQELNKNKDEALVVLYERKSEKL